MEQTLGGEMDGMRNDNVHAISRTPGPRDSFDGIRTIQQGPLIEVSESDGTFHVYADFRAMPDMPEDADIAVEFARQGMILTGRSVQRYVPLPTDAQIEHARVTINGGIVRMSVPTADWGDRWRSIVMW